MITLHDINVIEGEDETSEAEYYEAIQRSINAGMWGLQGSYGRTMMDAIKSGHCLLGQNDAHDYWGTHIPSRDQVQAGTKGSYDFVAEHCGEDWAQHMSEVQ
jgi:hypothetical protein